VRIDRVATAAQNHREWTYFLQPSSILAFVSGSEISAIKLALRSQAPSGCGPRPTSVSIAKSGFHDSGGTILQMPYSLASGAILRINSIGSFHSSSVGWYVGASSRPCGLDFFGGGLLPLLAPSRRSTVERSKDALFIALRGVCAACGWYPFELTWVFFAALPDMVDKAPPTPTAGEALELAFALLVPPLATAAPPKEGPAAIPGILTEEVLDRSAVDGRDKKNCRSRVG